MRVIDRMLVFQIGIIVNDFDFKTCEFQSLKIYILWSVKVVKAVFADQFM